VLRNLVRLDLLLGGRPIVVTAALFMAWFAFMLRQPRMPAGEFLLLGGLMSALFPLTLIVRESRFNAAAFTCSLPVTRRAVVAARYAEGVVLAIAGIGVAVAFALFLPWSHLAAPHVLAGPTLLLALCLSLVTVFVLLPLIMRLGIIGFALFLGVLQLLGILLLTLVNVLGKQHPIVRGVRSTALGLVALRDRLGDPVLGLVAVFALLLLGVASYRLSVFLFERRSV
jgi:hypothetical protein